MSNAIFQVNARRGRKSWCRFTVKTDRKVKMVVTVEHVDDHEANVDGLKMVVGALTKVMGRKVARQAMAGLSAKLDEQRVKP
jgi:hypothetical protein